MSVCLCARACVRQMAEHIRIALLDPKWKEKSGLLKPGEKEQTLAEHDEVTMANVGAVTQWLM